MTEIDEAILEAAGHLSAFGELVLNQGWGYKDELRELEEGRLATTYIDLAVTFLEFVSKAGIEKEEQQ